jgi:hypothetical protein
MPKAFQYPSEEQFDSFFNTPLHLPETKRCRFGDWLDFLSPEHREMVDVWIKANHDDVVKPNYVKIHEKFQTMTDISRDTIRHHLKGKCACR